MSVQRTIYCDNPTCADDKPGDSTTPCNVSTATPAPYLPMGVIETRSRDNEGDDLHHFCSWDCVMKYAAKQPVPEIITFDH